MDPTAKVVNGKLICLKQNHNDPVEMILMDEQVPLFERLLCLRCFKAKRQVSKYISIEEAQELIQEKLYKLNNKQEEQKIEILKDLNEFQEQIINIRSKIVQQMDEIIRISQLIITDITNIGRKSDVNNFIEDLQLLQSVDQVNLNQLNKNNQSHIKKICSSVKKLINIEDYKHCQNILKNILKNRLDLQQAKQQNISQPIGYSNKNNDNNQNIKKVYNIYTVFEKERSNAIAFNNSGSIMVTGCEKDIKVWKFEKGKMIGKKKLSGHTDDIDCLVFSKKHNWFASSSFDGTIRCWKEDVTTDWVSTQPGELHSSSVLCLILNNSEDQLISGSYDQTIKVWQVNCYSNQLVYVYTLEQRHYKEVLTISLNESETALVSCGYDKSIILWSKNENGQWRYKFELKTDDIGFRICFISDYQIIWQQSSQGITHLIEYKEGELIKRPDLNLPLNQETEIFFFSTTIRNKKKQVIIQKYNHYVYILKQQPNGQLSIVSEPIDCSSVQNFGNLTENGEYLTIWNYEKKQFQIYKIIYE